MFELKVKAVGLHSENRTPVLLLREKSGSRILPLGIGRAEAQAIVLAIQGSPPPRPISYDLMSNMLGKMRITTERVVIVELRECIFYAEIEFRDGKKMMTIDSRPSDAIALALRTETPIYITEDVAQQAMVEREMLRGGEKNRVDEEEREQFREFLDNIRPEDFADPDEPEGEDE